MPKVFPSLLFGTVVLLSCRTVANAGTGNAMRDQGTSNVLTCQDGENSFEVQKRPMLTASLAASLGSTIPFSCVDFTNVRGVDANVIDRLCYGENSETGKLVALSSDSTVSVWSLKGDQSLSVIYDLECGREGNNLKCSNGEDIFSHEIGGSTGASVVQRGVLYNPATTRPLVFLCDGALQDLSCRTSPSDIAPFFVKTKVVSGKTTAELTKVEATGTSTVGTLTCD